jgi:hypothetical protein
MRNLAIAALVLLAREPETLLDPSFQMSFSAVVALMAVYEWSRGGLTADEGRALAPLGLKSKGRRRNGRLHHHRDVGRCSLRGLHLLQGSPL